jgi:hypothetical protein
MTVKNLQSIIKDEGCKPTSDVMVKVSIQLDEDEWVTKVVPVESYFIQKDGTIQLGCCSWM